jgi:hypothetical protein
MRFYLKCLAAVVIFAFGLGLPLRQTVSDVAFDLRVAYVSRCGSAGDFEQLLDDTQKVLARQRGETECYEFGKRYHALLAQRLAEAKAVHVDVSEELRLEIEKDCSREAFSYTRWGRTAGDARRTELAAALRLDAPVFGHHLD